MTRHLIPYAGQRVSRRIARDPRPVKEDMVHRGIRQLLAYKSHRDLLYFHVPNSALITDSQRIYFAGLGTLPGVSDFCLTLPPLGKTAFLEVKSPKGRQSIDQKAFQARCEGLGIPYALVRSVDEAEAILSQWGALKKPPRDVPFE